MSFTLAAILIAHLLDPDWRSLILLMYNGYTVSLPVYYVTLAALFMLLNPVPVFLGNSMVAMAKDWGVGAVGRLVIETGLYLVLSMGWWFFLGWLRRRLISSRL